MKTNHNQLVAGHAVPQTGKLITESAGLNPRECHALACHCDMNLIGAAFVGTVATGLALHVHLKGCKPAPPVSRAVYRIPRTNDHVFSPLCGCPAGDILADIFLKKT